LVYATSTTDTINQADATTSKIPFGLIAYKPSSTTCWVKHNGIMGGYSGLTIGGLVYLSETAGEVTQTKPTTAGALIQVVGVAVSATEILFNIVPADKTLDTYGSMYLNDNATAQVIETADTPIGLRNFTTGTVFGFTYDAGNTAGITAYADYSGTVAGTVLATSATHGLTTGDYITIRGTTNYNGLFQITKVDDNSFYFTATWVADDGASDFDQASHLVCDSSGAYDIDWNLTLLEATTGGSDVAITPYVNDTALTPAKAIVTMGDATSEHVSGNTRVTLAANDWVYFTASSTGTNDITFSNGTMTVEKLN
jgi:hypothetical protein